MNTIELSRHARQDPANGTRGHGHINHEQKLLCWRLEVGSATRYVRQRGRVCVCVSVCVCVCACVHVRTCARACPFC